ncbi:hypothetical protein RhiLY_13064 [Ceratobasidium sp. AG-Ba]|nr:hypothetical protein RhiLY_13064 [Ceratobasidium sp. AG-Ba]
MLRQAGKTILSPINQTTAAVRKRTFKQKCLIDFTKAKHEAFLEWCKVFGDCITFAELEYRRDNAWIEHEFIRLGGLRLEGSFPQLPENVTGGIWDFFKPEDLEDLICRLERTADPKHYFNAPTGTDAWDWLTIYARGSENDEKDLSNSRQLLKITFSEKRTLDEVLNICYRVAIHPKSRDYTLPKYNCYFFSWNIILGLTRSSARYEQEIQIKRDKIVEEVLKNVRSFVCDIRQQFSLPLILTGHRDDLSRAAPGVPSSFMKVLEEHITSEPFIQALCARSSTNLWVSERSKVADKATRDLLDAVAGGLVPLVLAGTGASNLDTLFKRPEGNYWNLPGDWTAEVKAEVDRVIRIYLSEGMFKIFADALQQTDEATRLVNAANLTRQNMNLIQQAQFSDPVVLARLMSLGREAATKNTEVALSLDSSASKNPLARMGSSTKHSFQQHRNIMQIAKPFVSLVGARLEQNAARAKQNTHETKLPDFKDSNSYYRSLVTEIALQPDMNKQVLNELVTSVEQLNKKFPGTDHATLRRATLKLVVDTRNMGTKMNFFPEPVMIWQLFLWYSLSEGIVESIRKFTDDLKDTVEHECEWVEPETQSQAQGNQTNTQIQEWVQKRIKVLSGRMFKDTIGVAETGQRLLEKATSEIWEAQYSWRNSKYHQPSESSEIPV